MSLSVFGSTHSTAVMLHGWPELQALPHHFEQYVGEVLMPLSWFEN